MKFHFNGRTALVASMAISAAILAYTYTQVGAQSNRRIKEAYASLKLEPAIEDDRDYIVCQAGGPSFNLDAEVLVVAGDACRASEYWIPARIFGRMKGGERVKVRIAIMADGTRRHYAIPL